MCLQQSWTPDSYPNRTLLRYCPVLELIKFLIYLSQPPISIGQICARTGMLFFFFLSSIHLNSVQLSWIPCNKMHWCVNVTNVSIAPMLLHLVSILGKCVCVCVYLFHFKKWKQKKHAHTFAFDESGPNLFIPMQFGGKERMGSVASQIGHNSTAYNLLSYVVYINIPMWKYTHSSSLRNA